MVFLNKRWLRSIDRFFIVGVVATGIFAPVYAQDIERQLFNQLYNEIISSSPGGNIHFDSLSPKSDDAAAAQHPAGDSASSRVFNERLAPGSTDEQVREEIDKMVREIQTRHSEAIKFMQDGR